MATIRDFEYGPTFLSEFALISALFAQFFYLVFLQQLYQMAISTRRRNLFKKLFEVLREGRYPKYHYVFQGAYRFFYVDFLIFFYDSPLTILTLFLLAELGQLCYYLWFRPFKDLQNNSVHAFLNILFIILYIMLLVLEERKQTLEEQLVVDESIVDSINKIGKGYLVFILITIAVYLIWATYELILSLHFCFFFKLMDVDESKSVQIKLQEQEKKEFLRRDRQAFIDFNNNPGTSQVYNLLKNLNQVQEAKK